MRRTAPGRRRLHAAGLLCVLALAATGCRGDSESALEPITAQQTAAQPPDALVLGAAEAQQVTAPFALRADAAIPGALVLRLAQGRGSAGQAGRARLDFDVEKAGPYCAWARVKWDDSCGNSIACSVDDGSPVTVEDAVYGAWHWVQAGRHDLSAGHHSLVLAEREDGIALSCLLLTVDAAFRPGEFVSPAAGGATVRRFADDFIRSPGHGFGTWRIESGKWNIEFSYDPNSIPNQFTLAGEASDGPALVAVDDRPWNGCRLAVSLLATEGMAGIALDRTDDGGTDEGLRVGLAMAGGTGTLVVRGAGIDERVPLGDAVSTGQWLRLAVERWAWIVRVFVDEREFLCRCNARPGAGGIGLFVESARTVFDDVEAVAIPWQAEDGRDFRLPWRPGPGAQWFRAAGEDSPGGLVGRGGVISASLNRMLVQEIVVDDPPEAASHCTVRCSGVQHISAGAPTGVRLFRRPPFQEGGARCVILGTAGEAAAVRRVAVRYRTPNGGMFRVGSYPFSATHIPDLAEFKDFTPQEYAAMAHSPDAQKLKREPKMLAVIGRRNAPWERRTGQWRIADGVLTGIGPGAELRHGRDVIGDVDIRMKVRPLRPDAVAELELYGGIEQGTRVRLACTPPAAEKAEPGLLQLPALSAGEWHELHVRSQDGILIVAVDDTDPGGMWVRRRDAGSIILRVLGGRFSFDDIDIQAPRRARLGEYYAFDRVETGLRREGGEWIDHGGIACAFASNWISLVAPAGGGMLWTKRECASDVLVSLGTEENSEWYGWNRSPTHTHFPQENIRLALSPRHSLEEGYRLEVNVQHRRTALYRNGKEVATVTQDRRFPMQYVGGHAPTSPRRNHIVLSRRGAVLRVVINDQEVLRYEDPDPVAIAHVGLGGYRTRLNFSHVQIRDLRVPAPLPGD